MTFIREGFKKKVRLGILAEPRLAPPPPGTWALLLDSLGEGVVFSNGLSPFKDHYLPPDNRLGTLLQPKAQVLPFF